MTNMQMVLKVVAAIEETHHISAIADISLRSGLTRKACSTTLINLNGRGFVHRKDKGVYVLTQDGLAFLASGEEIKPGPRGSHKGDKLYLTVKRSLRHKAWIAMRRKRIFTLDEVTMLASETGEAKDKANISAYMSRLHQAGYITQIGVEAGDKLTSNGFKRWQLIKDTGELPPFKSRGVMVDRNNNLKSNLGGKLPCA
jgi:predicted transcriptional regulator of viral defense system